MDLARRRGAFDDREPVGREHEDREARGQRVERLRTRAVDRWTHRTGPKLHCESTLLAALDEWNRSRGQ